MSCQTIKKMCNHLVVSTAVRFNQDELVIVIPQGIYENQEKYCIVVAQNSPPDTTISARVVIRIAGNPTRYPLVDQNGNPVYACSISSRTRYSTKVVTTPDSGSFKLLDKAYCQNCINNLAYLPANL